MRPTRTRRSDSAAPRIGARRSRVFAAMAGEASRASTSKPFCASGTALRPRAQRRSRTRTLTGSGYPARRADMRTSGSRAAKRSTFSGESQKDGSNALRDEQHLAGGLPAFQRAVGLGGPCKRQLEADADLEL